MTSLANGVSDGEKVLEFRSSNLRGGTLVEKKHKIEEYQDVFEMEFN